MPGPRPELIIYGIKSCSTMKKARSWLDSRGIDYRFHDYRTAGVERELLARWIGQVGWESLLNRAGTTFRALPENRKIALDDASAAMLMIEQPAMIKRPVLVRDETILVGFKPERYAALFGVSA